MDNRTRNTAILVLITGVFLLIGKFIGYAAITGFILIGFAAVMFRKQDKSLAYILLVVGIVLMASNVIVFLLVLIVILMVYSYLKSDKFQGVSDLLQKNKFVESWRQDSTPWVLLDTNRRALIGEINLDLSLAMTDKEVTYITLEGIIGDVDIIVPEEMGLSVTTSVMLGDLRIGNIKESGAMNKIVWQSSNYDSSDYKVHLTLSYIIGDIDIKLL